MKSIRRSFFNLPYLLVSSYLPSDSSNPTGIISRIKREIPEFESYVFPSQKGTSQTEGNVNALVNWNDFVQTSGGYLQIEFRKGYVFPTHYSIKGYTPGRCFAPEWTLYGLNRLNEEMTVIAENSSVGSTFCGGTGKGNCNSNNWATFSVKPIDNAFKYFRLESKGTSCSGGKLQFLGGFEIYGLYYKSKAMITCYCRKHSGFSFYSVLIFSLCIKQLQFVATILI